MKNQKLTLILLFFLSACATAVHYGGGRSPSSMPDVPTGMSTQEMADFEHLSEGSDVYPYEWLLALKSANFKDSQGKMTLPFFNDFDKRFGFIKTKNLDSSDNRRYLIPYVGMTASWSNKIPQESDAFFDKTIDDNHAHFQTTNENKKSIRMVGVNCAACHTGGIQTGGPQIPKKFYQIEGSPSTGNIRGFFEDLAISTIATIAQKDSLIKFMESMGVPGAKSKAIEINKSFLVEFGKETGNPTYRKLLGKVGIENSSLAAEISSIVTFDKAKKGNRKRFFQGKQAIAMALEKLLRATYGFSETDDIGELRQRMTFLGTLLVGTSPESAETISGWGRTDAFGRIGNLVLRGNHPIDYTAPVSLPWIWGIKYMAMLHYTANTNSVMLRNMGQSLGLGAIILDDKNPISTVNVYNLDRLERLVHKIPIPQWEKLFADDSQMPLTSNVVVLQRGKDIYDSKCAHCHTAQKKPPPDESYALVGPEPSSLLQYNVLPLTAIGTDVMAAKNCVYPVAGRDFGSTILTATEDVKKAYYTRWNVDDSTQARYEWRDLRGKEFFRDTLNGYSQAQQDSDGNNYGKIDPGSGYMARHLSGVWATAPYLHNGSVPTIRDLLSPAPQRPKIFNVGNLNYDPYNLGFENKRAIDIKTGITVPCGPQEDTCFDTSLRGNSNMGHDGPKYGTVGLTDEDRTALIEYLKVLPPEDYYNSWSN